MHFFRKLRRWMPHGWMPGAVAPPALPLHATGLRAEERLLVGKYTTQLRRTSSIDYWVSAKEKEIEKERERKREKGIEWERDTGRESFIGFNVEELCNA